jgi:hypothetical protein
VLFGIEILLQISVKVEGSMNKEEGISCSASTGAEVSLIADKEKECYGMKFHFNGASFVSLLIPKPILGIEKKLPENFALTGKIRGIGKLENIEWKLLPDSETVWWSVKRQALLPHVWQEFSLKRRHFSYAWGRGFQDTLTDIERVELTITGGMGQSGEIQICDLKFEERKNDSSLLRIHEIRSLSGPFEAVNKEEKNFGQVVKDWHSGDLTDNTIEIDFDSITDFGALVIEWSEQFPVSYVVESRKLADDWRELVTIQKCRGGISYHPFPECEAVALRIRMQLKSPVGIRSLSLESFEVSSSWNSYYRWRAQKSSRGIFPRPFYNEQSYWTIVGVKGGKQKALINEEGMIELGYGLPSVECFFKINNDFQTWAGATYVHSLTDGHLPLPLVIRGTENIDVNTKVWSEKKTNSESLMISLELNNKSDVVQKGEFYFVLRPFSVNPPWQDLNSKGGFAPIYEIKASINESAFEFTGEAGLSAIYSETQCSKAWTTGFNDDDLVVNLSSGIIFDSLSAKDSEGHCSGAMQFLFTLKPKESTVYNFRVEYEKSGNSEKGKINFSKSQHNAVFVCQEMLQKFTFNVENNPDVTDTFKAQIGYILTNLTGPWIQPGSRCYRRSWIRDGALTSSALLRCGFKSEIKEFIEAYIPHVTNSGEVPCVVDRRGADHTPEYDSQGELIFLLAEYLRYTADTNLIEKKFTVVEHVVNEIMRLSDSTLTQEWPPYCRGLFPKSISHEGYSESPAFSYWDNFWGIKGLQEACYLATALNKTFERSKFETLLALFQDRVLKSLHKSIAHHGLDVIPGAADLGDFDPCSTTIGVDPCNIFSEAERSLLEKTFEKYWTFFEKRRNHFTGEDKYTPYEIRVVGTLSHLGHNREAISALDFFMAHRRPSGWRHWGEVVWANRDYPGFIGDAPHGWVGSDFIRSILALLFQIEDDQIAVGRGIPLKWWEGKVSFSFPIQNGRLDVEGSGIYNGKVKVKAECFGGSYKKITVASPIGGRFETLNSVEGKIEGTIIII